MFKFFLFCKFSGHQYSYTQQGKYIYPPPSSCSPLPPVLLFSPYIIVSGHHYSYKQQWKIYISTPLPPVLLFSPYTVVSIEVNIHTDSAD